MEKMKSKEFKETEDGIGGRRWVAEAGFERDRSMIP